MSSDSKAKKVQKNKGYKGKSDDVFSKMQAIRFGLSLNFLVVLLAISIGGGIGLAGDSINKKLRQDANAVLKTVYKDDSIKAEGVCRAAWNDVLQSYHYAAGMGAMALILCLVLVPLPANNTRKNLLATMLALGGIFGSLSWLLTGMYAPGIGLAKLENGSFFWLAIAGFSLYSLATLLVIMTSLFHYWHKK